MEHLFLYAAIIGGILFVGQLVLSLFGGLHDADLHDLSGVDWHSPHIGHGFEHSDAWFVGMLSFRAVVTAVTVFGLVGLSVVNRFEPATAAGIALVAGGGVMYGVAWVLRALARLSSDGTVRIEQAVGLPGVVYLAIPGRNAGVGKVTVKIQGRTMEFAAMTPGEELRTGTPVVIVDAPTPEMVEVAKAEIPIGENTHVEA